MGDYARRLAAECVRQGGDVRVVALCDAGTNRWEDVTEIQQDGRTDVNCLRMPAGWSWKNRQTKLQEVFGKWKPDWISLQFVPFGYHHKGLPWQLCRMLRSVRGSYSWHLMFHEVWVGSFKGAPVKLRVLGAVQRMIVRRLLEILKPGVIHTQARPHVKLLEKLHCQVDRLPLFGNIPVIPDGAEAGRELIFGEEPLAGSLGDWKTDDDWMIGGLFGAVHPEWQPEPFFSQWINAAKAVGRRPLWVIFGRHGRPKEDIDRLAAAYAGHITVRELGPLPDAQVSQVLQALDFGLVTTPWQLREKSGSLAAMTDHGLTVVVTRDDWKMCGEAAEVTNDADGGPSCLLARNCSQDVLAALRRKEPAPCLAGVASQFLSALAAAGTSRGQSRTKTVFSFF